jgi:hypothetical protein
MVGLRMDADEFAQCKAMAQAESRSAAQFALLMYRQGLAAWKKKQRGQKASR